MNSISLFPNCALPHSFLRPLLFLGSLLGLAPIASAEEIQFNRDIRPILSGTCFACHGPDSQARKADLRLDLRDIAIASKAIVPGNAAESPIIQRLYSKDADQVMPPPDSHKLLTEKQKKMLSDWVQAGAIYQPHWSFIAPTMPELPEVRSKSWVRNPIDRFVLARLEAAGLAPAPEADIRSLVRRVSFDLTGLPPTVEEVEEVVKDPAENRYEKYVDRLLQREQWGEHRGRHWLDYARYADTHGIHFDNFREMWAYRDWVIQAFNQNVPFDQFTIEQLAGDLLPSPTLDQKIATGFHRCNITTNEGGIIDEEYRVLYARDRTETTSQVWMALSLNCAVCHDHKFDPLTTKDFYSLSAFFNNTTQDARDGNRKDTPPIIPVPLREDRARHLQLTAEVEQARQSVEQARNAAKPGFETWLTSGAAKEELNWGSNATSLPAPEFQFPFRSSESESIDVVIGNLLKQVPFEGKSKVRSGALSDAAWVNQAEVRPSFPSLGDIERDKPFTISFWIHRPKKNLTGAVIARMDESKDFRGWDVWIEGDRIGMHFVHRWPENAIKVLSGQALPAETWTHVAITYDGSSKASGFQILFNGVAVNKDIKSDLLTDSVRTTVPFRIGSRSQQSTTPGVALQDLRLYTVALSADKIEASKGSERAAYLLNRVTKASGSKESGSKESATKEREELVQWYLQVKDPIYVERKSILGKLESEKQSIEARGTIAHIMNEKSEPAKAYILSRGEYDKRKDEVSPDTPNILPPFLADAPRNRLGLAKWLMAPENPLTARVTVNRFWQELFGTGIVATSGDFGISGQLPSHPELLDYLALSFRNDRWDIKNFFRQMVTSATYRQSSILTEQKRAIDAENRLLSRGPRFRLDAEIVRDSALAWSGLLSKKIGGPSVRPYQPVGVWEAVAMPESNTRSYKQDQGEGLYRRSMYTFWKRAAPPASMEIMNAPNRETCTVRRERTNTPIQALVTLNDPQFVEAARNLARRVLSEPNPNNEEASRLQRMSTILLARPLIPLELEIARNSIRDLKKLYADQPESAKQLLAVGEGSLDPKQDPCEWAAWTMLANQLMNLDEALNK